MADSSTFPSPKKSSVYGSITGRLGNVYLAASTAGNVTVTPTTTASLGVSTSPSTAGLMTVTPVSVGAGLKATSYGAGLVTVTPSTTSSGARGQSSTGNVTVTPTSVAAGDITPTPPEFIASATGGSGSTSGGTTSSTVVMPTVVAGDVAIIIHTNGTQVTYTAAPTGFTELTGSGLTTGQGLVVGTTHQVTVWYKILDGTEDATTYTITTAAASYKATVLVVYRGVNTTLPFNAWATGTDAAGTTITFPAVTPPNGYTTILRATGTERTANGADYTHTPPSGATELTEYASSRANSPNVAVEVNEEAGPVGLNQTFASETGTSSVSTVGGNFTFALSPLRISETFTVDAGDTTVTPTTTAAGYVTKATTAGLTTVDTTETANVSKTIATTAGLVTVTPTTSAVPAAASDAATAGAVTVTPTTTATPAASSKPSVAGLVAITPTPVAAGYKVTSSAAGLVAITPVTTASGATTENATAGAVTVTPTTTASPSGTLKPSTAGDVTVTPTSTGTPSSFQIHQVPAGDTSPAITTVAAGRTTESVVAGLTTVTPVSTASGATTESVTAGLVTVTPTTVGTPGERERVVIAGAITVTPVTTGTPAGTAKPSTAGSVIVTPVTVAVPALASDEGVAGPVTVTPTTSASATTILFSTAATTVTPVTTANAITWYTKFLKPDAILTMTGLSGPVANIQDSPTSPDGNALVPTGGGVDVRFSFENPGMSLRTNANDQTIRVLVTAG